MQNQYKKSQKINYVINSNYWEVTNRQELNALKNHLKKTLQDINFPIINTSTGLKAYMNSKSMGKLLFPAPYFNPFDSKYLLSLNALFKIEQLYKVAVYIDTLEAMKNKNNNELFHHFAAPLIMHNYKYRVLITASENIISAHLYIISVQVEPLARLQFYDYYLWPRIKIRHLVQDIKIYNYDTKDYQEYDLEVLENKNIIKEPTPIYSGFFNG